MIGSGDEKYASFLRAAENNNMHTYIHTYMNTYRYVQLIMIGNGDEKYASFLRAAENNNKGKVVGYVGFTTELEHKVMAGCDILLMPSRYACMYIHVCV